MAKEILFHGGGLVKETFDGNTFWTANAQQAIDYMDEGELYVIEIDWSKEEIADDKDYVDGDYYQAESNDENWDMQTQAIRAAVAAGATVVSCDDGHAIVNVHRLSPRLVSAEEALEIYWDE